MRNFEQVVGAGAAERVAALIAEYHIRPNHLRGQNFLIDDSVYKRIIETAKLTKQDHVLEVGPGLGTLTERLATVAGRVTAVEVDEKLAGILEYRFRSVVNVTIHKGDILRRPVRDYSVVPPYKVVSNIPYYLTGQFFRKFLSDDARPASMTVLIQKEVAERITAKPGAMSLLSLSVQLYGSPKLVCEVPRKSFRPVPNVDSALLHVADIHPFPLNDVSEKFFWSVAKVGFAAPRKQLKNNLLSGFPDLSPTVLDKMFSTSGLSPKVRAQELPLAAWHALAVQLLSHVPKGV